MKFSRPVPEPTASALAVLELRRPDHPLAVTALNFGRKLEQAQQVGYGRAVSAYQTRHFRLRNLEFLHQPPVPLRLIDRREIIPLQIFYERQGQKGLIVGISNHGRNRRPPQPLNRAPASLAGDELVAAPARSHHYRLE